MSDAVDSKRRGGVVAASVLAHALVLAALLQAQAETPQSPEIGAINVSLYDGKLISAAQTPPAPAPAPKMASETPSEPKLEKADIEPPPEIEPQVIDVLSVAPDPLLERDPLLDPVALAVAASSAAGQPCQLTVWLQQALQADPQVQIALPLIPRPARSVANAIMLWNGAWVEPPAQASGGVSTLQQALIAGIRAAPIACQDQVIHGPELIILLDGAGATVLAIGSGDWRWADLLKPAHERTTYSVSSAIGGGTPLRPAIRRP